MLLVYYNRAVFNKLERDVDKVELAIGAGVITLVAIFATLVIRDVFIATETQVITLDSGKQCVATVKGNDITNLDCEG